MKIGVSGASGHLGRAVVSELLQRPGAHEIVAITRTPETVSGPAQGRFGDYNRPESLAEAYAGLDRLLIIPTLGWEHINLTGDYHWETFPTLGPDQFRPLRTRAHDFAAAA
jgi:uncharacterized protein YbjT (DUF2867 family)